MMKKIRDFGLTIAAVALLLPATAMASVNNTKSQPNLDKAVRHELLMLPYYNIFDELAYRIDGNGNVTLYGAVTRPVLKSDAANAVKRIEGVESVTNNIEVLPLSRFDDQIRFAVARAIYGYGPMQRYALGAQPPIHIIVRNGHVTLTGVVANQFDRNIAGIRANGVAGVFSVDNNLQVEGRRG